MPFAPWVTTLLGVLTAVVVPLVGWAFRLQLKNAALEARVSVLEGAAKDTSTELKNISNTQTAMLITLERILTRMQMDRKGDA